MKRLFRVLLMICGLLCVALGFVGMFLPLLPTTPFLLLAAFCFARSSDSFYQWLLTNRWCGEYIKNYREGKGLSRKHKALAIGLMWLTLGYSVGFVKAPPAVKVFLTISAASVTVHLLRLKTLPVEAAPRSPRDCGL